MVGLLHHLNQHAADRSSLGQRGRGKEEGWDDVKNVGTFVDLHLLFDVRFVWQWRIRTKALIFALAMMVLKRGYRTRDECWSRMLLLFWDRHSLQTILLKPEGLVHHKRVFVVAVAISLRQLIRDKYKLDGLHAHF